MKFIIAITIAVITAVSALQPHGHNSRDMDNLLELRSCGSAGSQCDPDDHPFCCSHKRLAQCVVESPDDGPVLQIRRCPLGCVDNGDGANCARE
jgi:hypothetical protein